jgi:hypothetical protein
VQIWHGASDTTVVPANADELLEQWTDVHGLTTVADATEMVGAATRSTYARGGEVVVESYRIAGMGHAVVVGSDPLGACAGAPGAFFIDKGVCSTLRAAQFFGLTGDHVDGGGDGHGSDGGDAGGPHGGGAIEGGFGCRAGGSSSWLIALVVAAWMGAMCRRREPTIGMAACRARPTARG